MTYAVKCSFYYHSFPFSVSLKFSYSLLFSLFFPPLCVSFSQWTVAGAAGHSGALAVERATSALEGATDLEPTLLQLSADAHVKETELGLTPVALNPVLVRRHTVLII